MADDEEVRRAVEGDQYNNKTIDLEDPEPEEDDTYEEKIRERRESVEEAIDWVVNDATSSGGYQGETVRPAGRFERRDSFSGDERSNYDKLGWRLGNYIKKLPEDRQHGEFQGEEYDIGPEDGENIADLIEQGEYEDAKGYARAVATIAGDEELGSYLTQKIGEIQSQVEK